MKRKLLYLVAIIMIPLVIVGCTKEEKKEMTNPAFGKYNGIYKLNNYEFRILHVDDYISSLFYDGDELKGMDSSIFEEDTNKIELSDFKLEFKDDVIAVKGNNKELPSGDFKKVSGYSTDEIYADYIGELDFYDSDFNGLYENESGTVYSIQLEDKRVKIYYANDEEDVSVELDAQENNSFMEDLFGTKYEAKYDNNELKLSVIDEDGNSSKASGIYTKKAKLTKEEVIKNFYK
jgi:hypothetical protein